MISLFAVLFLLIGSDVAAGPDRVSLPRLTQDPGLFELRLGVDAQPGASIPVGVRVSLTGTQSRVRMVGDGDFTRVAMRGPNGAYVTISSEYLFPSGVRPGDYTATITVSVGGNRTTSTHGMRVEAVSTPEYTLFARLVDINGVPLTVDEVEKLAIAFEGNAVVAEALSSLASRGRDSLTRTAAENALKRYFPASRAYRAMRHMQEWAERAGNARILEEQLNEKLRAYIAEHAEEPDVRDYRNLGAINSATAYSRAEGFVEAHRHSPLCGDVILNMISYRRSETSLASPLNEQAIRELTLQLRREHPDTGRMLDLSKD